MTQQSQVIGVKELYQAYVDKLLKENPDFWTLNNRGYNSVPRFYVYKNVSHRSGGTTPEEVISYPRFRAVLESYFRNARSRIIRGETFQLWNQIGSISARRVERNFSKKVVDWAATNRQNKRDPETGKLVLVYFDTPDWCRIGWNRPKSKKKISKIKQYEFKPADGRGKGGFNDEFREIMETTPAVRLAYDYHPHINAVL